MDKNVIENKTLTNEQQLLWTIFGGYGRKIKKLCGQLL